MKFRVKEWSLIELYKKRNQLNFPVFQRGMVWSEKKNKLLIDSILKGIDIPKLYLQETEHGWDVIDGQQRIRAIVGFFDEDFRYDGDTFNKLSKNQQNIIESYKLTITEVSEITEEEIRLLFTRLQLGVPLNSGEKLNAIKSNLGEFVKTMTKKPFIVNISIPSRRFAKEQVCAQICNNSLYINKSGEYRNSKYEDLATLYRINKDFNTGSRRARAILRVLDKLDAVFSKEASELRNRASVVSIYLLVEKIMDKDEFDGKKIILKNFYLEFIKKIKQEVSLGIDATNHFLINYQSRVIQGADTKSSITMREESLLEAFQHYQHTKKIPGF